MFRSFTNQVTQAYMVLMANLTKLLGALDYQDANSIIPELKEILLLEVDLIKVIFTLPHFSTCLISLGMLSY